MIHCLDDALAALEAPQGPLTGIRDPSYRDCPRDPAERAAWLAERARARELTGPVLNPPVPTREEAAEVVPLKRRKPRR